MHRHVLLLTVKHMIKVWMCHVQCNSCFQCAALTILHFEEGGGDNKQALVALHISIHRSQIMWKCRPPPWSVLQLLYISILHWGHHMIRLKY